MESDYKFKRVLLKLSGEAIARKDEAGHVTEIFDGELIARIAGIIKKLVDDGVQVGVVIGGGNIWRGAYGKDVVRARADQMGMLSTMMNSLRLEDAIEKAGCPVTVMTHIGMNSFAEPYDFRKAVAYLESGKVVIFGAGLGIPFITTDTTVVVRAAEIGADVILMAKNIDGVYTADPAGHPEAKRYRVVSYDECLAKDLHATDISASALAKEQKINMYVFELKEPENILRAAAGEEIGTLVTYDGSLPAELY